MHNNVEIHEIKFTKLRELIEKIKEVAEEIQKKDLENIQRIINVAEAYYKNAKCRK